MTIGAWSKFHTPYNETEVRKLVPKTAGVYTLWVRYTSGNWKCFYVGKAENREESLIDHLSAKESNSCITEQIEFTCGFCWLEVTTEEERSGVVKYLYDSLKPECNLKNPGGKPLKIPLPVHPAPAR